ncbi:MAG: SPOR domain-containing protein [Salinivirgaceae bacterium]
MSVLSNYISSLLYLHNCVIVPELGGFVSNYQSAEIDYPKERVYPPSKSVAFNASLTRDDGLLINYIAYKQELSYSAAAEWLMAEVKDIKHTLLTDGLLILDGLGAFYLNENRKISFRTDLQKNLLGDSYGLASVKLPFSMAKTSASGLKTVPIDQKPGIMITKRTLIRAAAVLGPILVIAALFPVGKKIFTTGGDSQNAGLTPSSEQQVIIPANNSKSTSNQKTNKEYRDSVDEVATQKKQALYYSETETVHVYHIIAGSFNQLSSAQKAVKKLNDEGANASVLHENGKYRVSYQKFTDRYEALQRLDFLRRTNNKSYWLHKVEQEAPK